MNTLNNFTEKLGETLQAQVFKGHRNVSIGLYDRSKRVIFISKMVGRDTEAELILR